MWWSTSAKRATVYSVKQVSALTGATEATLRVWERRYGVVEPARSAAGYRLYDDEQVAVLRAMVALVNRRGTGVTGREDGARDVGSGTPRDPSRPWRDSGPGVRGGGAQP